MYIYLIIINYIYILYIYICTCITTKQCLDAPSFTSCRMWSEVKGLGAWPHGALVRQIGVQSLINGINVTLCLFNIAMENGQFVDGLPGFTY